MTWDELGREEGRKILDDIESYLRKFVAYPSPHAVVAHVLWVAHAHLLDAWESTPRILFASPEPGSGKTRCLEATENLVPRPVEAVNVTPAYLFRKVASEEGRPTILFDEIDTVFGPKAKDNEEIRGMLNAGHRRSGVAGRCVLRGKIIETEEIPAYCAVAMAGLGTVPDTILARSIVIRMRRRAPEEVVEPYRRRIHGPEGQRLRDRLASWAAAIEPDVTDIYPDIPDSIVDRDADVWEPLLAVADAAGGDWPERARVSAVTHVTDAKAATPSLGIRLLSDIRKVFGDDEQIATEHLLTDLHHIEEAPWGDLRGKPLDARGLARRLSVYDVKPTTLRTGATTAKGYRRTDLHDAWVRYLGPAHYTSVTCGTSDTERMNRHAPPRAAGQWVPSPEPEEVDF